MFSVNTKCNDASTTPKSENSFVWKDYLEKCEMKMCVFMDNSFLQSHFATFDAQHGVTGSLGTALHTAVFLDALLHFGQRFLRGLQGKFRNFSFWNVLP